jgi:hypothetical protein
VQLLYLHAVQQTLAAWRCRILCSCNSRLRVKCDGTHAETRFRLSAKRTSPFKSAGASVQSTAGSRGVRISGSNGGYVIFRGSVKSTGYPLHSPVSPSLPRRASPCAVTFQLDSTPDMSIRVAQDRHVSYVAFGLGFERSEQPRKRPRRLTEQLPRRSNAPAGLPSR